jgi:hypothetical protein
MEVPATRRLIETDRSPDKKGRRTRLSLESSRPGSRRLASIQKSVRARSTFGPTVLCYALLRMRPLSISWAECSVVISCGKIDYDKSG